jgi:hypothetical protein
MDRDRLPILVEDLGHGPYPHCFAELRPADVLHTYDLPLDQWSKKWRERSRT